MWPMYICLICPYCLSCLIYPIFSFDQNFLTGVKLLSISTINHVILFILSVLSDLSYAGRCFYKIIKSQKIQFHRSFILFIHASVCLSCLTDTSLISIGSKSVGKTYPSIPSRWATAVFTNLWIHVNRVSVPQTELFTLSWHRSLKTKSRSLTIKPGHIYPSHQVSIHPSIYPFTFL